MRKGNRGMRYFNTLFYNSEIKISGNIVTIKAYEKKQPYAYLVEKKNIKDNHIEKIVEIVKDFFYGLNNYSQYHKILYKYRIIEHYTEKKREERFIKSSLRARQNIFDLIQCNTGKHLDYEGKKQTTKFLTLTFEENITDLEKANQEFTKFMKRLSYYAYKIKKNVIKYIAVPELQKRGAWHYHIVLFNVKYIPWHILMKIWGKGSVYINALKKDMQGTEIAKYVTKYISKALKVESKAENIANYKLYKEKGLVNKKRYNCSRGLLRPFIRKLDMDIPTMDILYKFLLKEKVKNSIPYYKEYYNEHRGNIQILSIEVNKKVIKDIKDFLNLLVGGNMEKYKREKVINWEKIKRIREKQIQDMILYDIERYYQYELERYEKITKTKVG